MLLFEVTLNVGTASAPDAETAGDSSDESVEERLSVVVEGKFNDVLDGVLLDGVETPIWEPEDCVGLMLLLFITAGDTTEDVSVELNPLDELSELDTIVEPDGGVSTVVKLLEPKVISKIEDRIEELEAPPRGDVAAVKIGEELLVETSAAVLPLAGSDDTRLLAIESIKVELSETDDVVNVLEASEIDIE